MPKERNKADGYREKAYEGDTKAMNNLGVCYERGTGVKVNLEMAFEWYLKAADLGDVYGCFNVGECYYHGKGVEQNAELAFEWYMKAADKGDMQSQVNVANAYYSITRKTERSTLAVNDIRWRRRRLLVATSLYLMIWKEYLYKFQLR